MDETIYKYVGKTDYDCIGLVNRLCESYGITMPNISTAKLQDIDLKDLRFGDIMAFDFHGVGADHLAFYICDNQFIHHLDTTGVIISNIERRYFMDRFRGLVVNG